MIGRRRFVAGLLAAGAAGRAGALDAGKPDRNYYLHVHGLT